MHGNGEIKWPDGRCYKGVILFLYISNMKMIKNMGRVYFYGKMGGNILEFGKMENNMVLEFIIQVIINFVLVNG